MIYHKDGKYCTNDILISLINLIFMEYIFFVFFLSLFSQTQCLICNRNKYKYKFICLTKYITFLSSLNQNIITEFLIFWHFPASEIYQQSFSCKQSWYNLIKRKLKKRWKIIIRPFKQQNKNKKKINSKLFNYFVFLFHYLSS